MTAEGSADLPMRWPWQTREDALIRLLDAVLAEAKESRSQAARVTEDAKKEASRRFYTGGQGDEGR